VFRFIQDELRDYYPDAEVKSFSYLILESVCLMDKSSVLRHKDKKLSSNELLRIQEIIYELKKHRPIQYILSETEFFGMKFKVDENVLIPRPETEELVECVIKDKPPPCPLQNRERSYSILDIGTGSGCIAVALAKYLPEAEVFAFDISDKALNVARQNAINNEVNVIFFQYDILKNEPYNFPVFDCIVSNPPYITMKEKETLEKNVLDYEPHQALFVPDGNPLLFYERIADFSRKHLAKSGSLYLETSSIHGWTSAKVFEDKKFSSVKLIKDISGNDRIIIAKL